MYYPELTSNVFITPSFVQLAQFMVALMLSYQPLLMGGIENHEVAKSNAYGAMATFFFAFLISVIYLIKQALSSPAGGDRERMRRSGGDYDGLPHSSGPGVGYEMDLDLPASVAGVYS